MLNVTDPASIESVLENIRAEFGEVDIWLIMPVSLVIIC